VLRARQAALPGDLYLERRHHVSGLRLTRAICAGLVLAAAATVTTGISPVSALAPVAVDDVYEYRPGSMLVVDSPGLLANDGDPESEPITVSGYSVNAAHGTLNLSADGSFTYMPDAGFIGSDTFTYEISDDSAVDDATVRLNPPPTWTGDGDGMTWMDQENWSASVGPGSNLLFPIIGGPVHTLVNDFPWDTEFGSITFTGPGYVIWGNPLRETGGVSALHGEGTTTIHVDVDVAETGTRISTGEGAALDLDGVISGVDGITKTGMGQLTLNEGNTYLGTTFVAAGSLVVTRWNSLGSDTDPTSVSDGASLQVVGSMSITEPLSISGAGFEPFAALFAVLGHVSVSSVTLVDDATIGVGSGADLTITNTLDEAFSFNGDFPQKLTKNGLGRLIVAATATYRGDTEVAAGSLEVTGSIGSLLPDETGAPVIVDSGATLAVLGSIGSPISTDGGFVYGSGGATGSVAVYSGVYSAGYGRFPHISAARSLSLAEGSTFAVIANGDQPGAGGYDQVNVGNGADIDGAALNVSLDYTPVVGDDLKIIHAHSEVGGTFAGLPEGAEFIVNETTFRITYTQGGGSDVDLTVVNATTTSVNADPSMANNRQNVTLTAVVTSTGSAVPTGTVTFRGETSTPIGTATLNSGGVASIVTSWTAGGRHTFTATYNGDGASAASTGSNFVDVDHVVPIAVADDYTVAEDTQLYVPAPGVLVNDSDGDGETIWASLFMYGPEHGTLTFNGDGSFTYTPFANYSGSDTFLYQANDGNVSDPVAVTFTVTAVDDAPHGVDDTYYVNVDGTLTVAAPGVLGNDSDVEGDAVHAVRLMTTESGSLNLAPNGSFVYHPLLGFHGVDHFVYTPTQANDLGGLPVTVTIIINGRPSGADDFYDTTEDTTLTVAAPGVLGNDSDPDSDPLTAVLAALPAHGHLSTFSADGSFTYIPDPDFHGIDAFYYYSSDGTNNGAWTAVTITTASVYDRPVATDDAYTTLEDTVLDEAAPGLLANDFVDDNLTLDAGLVASPEHGSAVVSSDGSFTYTPDANFAGTDSFTYRDREFLNNDISYATVTITVTAVDDDPVSGTDSYSVNEDASLVVAAPGVLANDFDPDGTLTAALVSGPSHGSLTFDADGSFSYTADPNFNGTDSFAYQVSDGGGSVQFVAAGHDPGLTVTITVAAVNDAPVAAPVAPQATTSSAPLSVAAPGPLADATDADGDPLTAVLVTAPAHGTLVLAADGSYTYTAAPGFSGSDSFTYAASDGSMLSNPVTITIMVASEAPVPPADPVPPATPALSPTAPVDVAPVGELPTTGSTTSTPLRLAATLLAVGCVVVVIARRRRIRVGPG
jgi:autotransporter-associated beta strand protein/VCBS repeat-containing protein